MTVWDGQGGIRSENRCCWEGRTQGLQLTVDDAVRSVFTFGERLRRKLKKGVMMIIDPLLGVDLFILFPPK